MDIVLVIVVAWCFVALAVGTVIGMMARLAAAEDRRTDSMLARRAWAQRMRRRTRRR